VVEESEPRLDHAVREAGGRVIAALAARFRDLDLAEEAFAFACAAAVEAWRRDGAPRDPVAWLYAAARRRGFDLTRRAKVRGAYRPDALAPPPTPEEVVLAALEPIPDERLRLIFTCCHPALAVEARIALTLRTICGLSVERLARAFLTTEAAMTQRLTRARRKIAQARIPFEVPGPEAWGERLEAVLAALEIAYAQAYEDGAGVGEAAGLAGETLRLSRVLCELTPEEPEVLGLAALIRLAEARRPARLDAGGRMVPLAEQDVSLWDETLLDEAVVLLRRAAGLGRSGPYQVMAAIHATHASRRDTGVTPWADIVALYDALIWMRPSPVAQINRAIALGQAAGPQAALDALGEVDADGRIQAFAPYHAARAHLLEQAGRIDEAAAALARSLELTQTPAERDYLAAKLESLNPTSSRTGR
jgi:RNA polymerase sigma-70 factor (ECF subfamily)